MKNKKFLQSGFIFWPKEEIKEELGNTKQKLRLCNSYQDQKIIYVEDDEDTKTETRIIMIDDEDDTKLMQDLMRVKNMKVYFEDSINDILMYFKRESEYLSKMFFQTFYTFDDLTLNKQSREKTKKSMEFKRHKILKERSPEIKENTVLLI